MITSQDYTDMVLGAVYTGGGDKAIEDGVYLRLNELMDKYAPDYMKILNSDPKILRDATTDTGNRFRFCQLTDVLQQQFAGLQIREDWLEDLGITELPNTYDEYHDLLVKFRDQKNGGEGPFYLHYSVGSALQLPHRRIWRKRVSQRPEYHILYPEE
jgi:putative aldouronate transport system substrate-binding protein